VRDYWKVVIQPLLKAAGARTILEIGAERGIVTEELAVFAYANGGVTHSVDPAPLFDMASLEMQFGSAFRFHRACSLEVLPSIGAVDLALIDGDHNWFTVLSELRLLRQTGTLPITVLHDIGWPYGRRDLYYDPETIPEEARHPHARLGVLPGVGDLTVDGFNSDLAHAEVEGGPRNGVLTAIEDFIAETKIPLRFVKLDGLHGLGILIAEERLETDTKLCRAVMWLESKAFAREQIALVEEARLGASLAVQRLRRLDWARGETKAAAEPMARERRVREEKARLDELLAARTRELESLSQRLRDVESSLADELSRELAMADARLRATTAKVDQERTDRAYAIEERDALAGRLETEASAHDRAREELTRAAEALRGELVAAREESATLEVEAERLRSELSADRGKLVAQQASAALLADRVEAERAELAAAARRLSTSRSWRFGHGFFLALKRLRPGRTRRESALDLIVERLERPLVLPVDIPDDRPAAFPAAGVGEPAPVACLDPPTVAGAIRGRLDPQVLDRLAAAPPVTVVVPVHNAAVQTRRCVEALARNTSAPAGLLIIDDASTDPETIEQLRRFEGLTGVRFVRNDVNQGFTPTVNRGLTETDGDVVLLNSDTEVGPRWLESLRAAAYSAPDIGSVTPLSNNAGAFSAPVVGQANPVPSGLGVDDVARLIAQSSHRVRPRTPTGNGFCLYMKREMINAVGLFDAESFPRGYGEENDYCMRAGDAGWRHVVDDATFVRHEREASFGDEKARLSEAGRATVDRLHPSYTSKVRRFVRSPEMDAARAAVRLAFAQRSGAPPRPRLLFVIHEGGGGTPATSEDLIRAVEADYDCYVLASNSQTVRLRHYGEVVYEVDVWELETPWRVTDFTRPDFTRIALEVLSSYAIELVHVRHLFKHSLDVPRVAQLLGIPVVVSLHDFYLACPTVHLLDDRDRYCGGVCTSGSGTCRRPSALLQETPPLKNAWVHTWREEVGSVLHGAAALVTTSPHAREVYKRAYPDLSLPFEIIEHGRDFAAKGGVAQPPVPGQPLRILVAGSFEFHKGSQYLARLKELDTDGMLDFHLLGPKPPDEVAALGTHHGPYERDEFATRAAEVRPSIIGIFSVCPETYCHVLTEAWAAGIPAVATDIGALGERLRKHGGGWLVPHDDPAAAYEQIKSLHADKDAFDVAVRQIAAMELRDTAAMARDFDALYRRVLQARRAIVAKVDVPEMAALNSRVIRLNACVPGEPGKEPGSTHVRVLTRLSHPAIATKVQTAFPGHERLLCNGDRPDAVLVQRTAMRPSAVPELLDQAHSMGTPLIVELDDDLLALDDDPAYGEHIEAIRALVGAAALVIVSTPALASALADQARKIAVVPNALDERLWFDPLPDGLDMLPNGDNPVLRLLYMGTRTHAHDLKLLRPVLTRLREKAGLDVRLEVIGGEAPGAGQDWYDRITVPSGHSVYPRFVRWLRCNSSRWDIAVAPLVDSDFNRSKSDLKFLEYAALRLPTIVSDVEAYREVRHEVDGYKVSNDPEAWSEALLTLASDPDLRRQLARTASSYVRSSRCLEVESGRYLSTLCDVIEPRSIPAA
jgi:GT2 family glycosyltransferase/glycosyltransferase involved in cell wall biosynthesis